MPSNLSPRGELPRDPEPVMPGAESIRLEIDRILSSATFRNADRLSRFLRYVADQSARGASEAIKEYSIGVEVFERGPEFDPRSDSVVRVEARRLRSKLRDYYDAEGCADPVIVSIPKGSYIPAFRAAAPGLPVAKFRSTLRGMQITALVAVLGIAAFLGWTRMGGVIASPSPVVLILPLENLSSDASNDNFCHAFSDEIASHLSREARARVITRGPAGPFLARADLAEAAKLNRAGFAFEGSATFSEDRVRVTAMLVELSGFTNVWLETYDRPIRDRLSIQSELSAAIAKELRPRLK